MCILVCYSQKIHMWMQLYGIWYLSFSDWLSSFSINPFHSFHVIVNGFISSLLMTQWCRSVYIYHIFLPIHLSMDIWAVSTVWLLLIMLLQTLRCVSLLESTKVLLYPRGKYLALQFWNHRVALFLTSFFLNFFYDSHRERGRDTGRGRSRLHAPGAQSGIRSQVSRITPWAKDRHQTTAPPRDPPFFFNFSRTLHTVFHSDYICSHAHQECKGATLSPLPHQHLLFLVLLILAIMTAVRWHIIVVLVCISLTMGDALCLSMCLVPSGCLVRDKVHSFFCPSPVA